MIGTLERLSALVNRALAWIAGFALVAMMLFTVLDMASRYLGWQVAGSYEVIGWLMAVSVALALGTTQRHHGHVAINLLTQHLGARAQVAMELLTSMLSLLLFCAATWYLARYGRVLHTTGSLSETLKAIVFPWVYVVAAGTAGLGVALLVDFLRAAMNLCAVQRRPY